MVRLLAYVTGSVNQELLLQNEYLAAENRILRAKLPARLRLSDPERATLAEIGKRVGRRRSGDCLRRQAGHNPGLVSQARCEEVRWFKTSTISRASQGSTGSGSFGGAHGEGEYRLGI